MGEGPRAWRPRTWGVVALVAVILVVQTAGALDGGLYRYTTGLSLVVLDLLGIFFSLRAARRDNRTGWLLTAAGRLLSLISMVLLAIWVVTDNSALWWVGTMSRLLMYASFAAAVVVASTQRVTGRQRYALAAEAVTVLGGGFMVVWYFTITKILDDGHTFNHMWIASIGYPIGDLLLLAALSQLVLRGILTRATSSGAILAAGLATLLVGDGLWEVGSSGARAQYSPSATSVMVVSSLLLTVAAMMNDRRTPPARGRQQAWTAYLPVAALAVGSVLMIVVTVQENDMTPWGGLVLGLIVMSVAIAVRQSISLRDSRDLIVSDPLTGLANRTGLDQALQRAIRRRDAVALLLVDLDGFKPVNDAYGHAAGDTMLVEVAHHIRSAVRAGDVAARIGGDEFAVLLTGIATEEQAGAVAQRILAAAAAGPVRLGDDVLPIRASVGVAVGRENELPQEVLRRADVAMYEAKRAGAHGWVAHDDTMTDRRTEDAALTEDLSVALERGELTVVYQPIVDLADGHPIAVEALVRWRHPERGQVPPTRFVPIAERSGVIAEIGLFVLDRACAELARWRSLLPAGQRLYVSVNVSPRQLQEPTLVHDVLATLHRHGVPPEGLVLEVTESAIVDQAAIEVLAALRTHGIRIAIDDFGTGYSSLHYLTRLPVDILKIDRSFVAELNGTPEGSAITEAVIRLGQVLHLLTVAEGIETAAQAAELQMLGCVTGQGYLFSRPQAADDLDPIVTAVRNISA